MNKFNWKKYINIFLVLVFIISIFYNINGYLNDKRDRERLREANKRNFLTISVFGNNTANKLEEFVKLTNQKETSEIKDKLGDLWGAVVGQNKSSVPFLLAISTQHTVDEEMQWGLYQYGLIRIDEYLFSMTIKFLKQGSYALSSEEKEILEAIITVYRTFEREIDNDAFNLKNVLQHIQEPMMVIDHHYKGTLELLERNK